MKKRTLILLVITGLAIQPSGQEETKATHLPVFDIHVHASRINPDWANPLCPWFLSNMPGADPNDDGFSFLNQDCLDPLMPAESDGDLQEELVRRIHEMNMTMGTGGNGMTDINNPRYRASMGNPFLLEELLARHPKMKIWVMHAGYPMLEEMIALKGYHAFVYLDISGFIWSYPLDEIHYYIKRLVQAGFGKRIMYGTDFMMWPRMIETSMGVIEHAQYLSEEQKRDILFNNAARFFRMEREQFEWPED